MITGFDHVVIAANDVAAGAAAYELLIGRRAEYAEAEDGDAAAVIGANNIAVELIAARSAAQGEGLAGLVFAVDDIERAHRRCERVALAPQAIGTGLTFSAADTHGVRLLFTQRAAPAPTPAGEAAVTGLDHVVIRTPDCERAAALYGARLGLDMRLDREVAGRRLMFFRCGDAIVEIAHAVDIADGRDRLWGLSWRVADAEAARARLAAAGLDVSEVRPGLKPGTRVFTVRGGTCAVPTLMIEPSPKRD